MTYFEKCQQIAYNVRAGNYCFPLTRAEYDGLPLHHDWRDEASTREQLFRNYMGSLGVKCERVPHSGDWRLRR